MSARVRVNLVALALVSAALVAYAVTELVVDVVLDRTYPVTVLLPETGGLFAGQEVTLNGRAIGSVGAFTLTDDGVAVELEILHDEDVPVRSEAVVLRRSAIGEQAVDLRPRQLEPVLAPGDTLDPVAATTPVEVQPLLEQAAALVGEIDPDELGTVMSELADAVEGRRDDIRRILVAGADVSEAVGDARPDIERLATSGRVTFEALDDNREALVAAVSGVADTAELLARSRDDLTGLLAEAPSTLGAMAGIAERGGPDFACAVRDLASFTAAMDTPTRIEDLGEALRHNQWFFVGIEIGAVSSLRDGAIWNRTRVLPPQPRQGESFLPDKRPIADVLPGGGCGSPLGAGSPRASQPGHELLIPEATLVPPGG